jgi:hypothetical protein
MTGVAANYACGVVRASLRQDAGRTQPLRLGGQARRLNLPRYAIKWSGHVQTWVQGAPSRNRGVFPAVDHDRSRT